MRPKRPLRSLERARGMDLRCGELDLPTRSGRDLATGLVGIPISTSKATDSAILDLGTPIYFRKPVAAHACVRLAGTNTSAAHIMCIPTGRSTHACAPSKADNHNQCVDMGIYNSKTFASASISYVHCFVGSRPTKHMTSFEAGFAANSHRSEQGRRRTKYVPLTMKY